ncbi:HIV Tat-specific factor 1 [Mactra antiquata]
MGDIDFEEQLELERLEREKREKLSSSSRPTEKIDPDGTAYEWDADKQAWFPKIDTDFIAKYQMSYGSSDQNPEAGTNNEQAFFESYNQAQMTHERLMNRKKEESTDETHAETVQKLENLESRMLQQVDEPSSSEEYQAGSKEDMEKYSEEQKKQYNEYWSYYYGTEYHDYYADCMAQYENTSDKNSAGESLNSDTNNTANKKSGKKRKGPKEQREEGWFDVSEEHNTNVYVSGLPFDVTEEEFKELMNKYGLIMYDPRSRKPKLKLYLDENGQPKGDGRCCFIKKESVDLVLNLLDGSDFRGHTLKVERAQFSLKGSYDPSKKKKKLSNKEKRKLKEKQAKLFDWRPDKPRGARARNEKVVVLKNVFDAKSFEEDPLQINVTRDAIKMECTKYGEVKKVIVYDCHVDGVVTVHFGEAEEADMCIEYMNQRYWGTRRLLAATWDGTTKYEVVESEAQREERLKKWENFLEKGEESSKKEAAASKPDENTAVRANDTGKGFIFSENEEPVPEKSNEPTDMDSSDNINDVPVKSSEVEESVARTSETPVDAT